MSGALKWAVLAGVGWLLTCSSVAAQDRPPGRLSGVVRDETGAVIAGAAVTINGGAPAAARTAVTDAQGRYEFANLAPGRYTVDARADGFQTHSGAIDVSSRPVADDIVLAIRAHDEQLTVTATKAGATDIQQTPIAITALPHRTLQNLGIDRVAGLAGFVPSMTVAQPLGLMQVTIRGIGSNTIITGADPSVTIHMDGVYLARPASALFEFLDVERVEVLRGPQGTLYGRNSVGGAINVVTRQPTNALDTSARLTAGADSTLRAEGAVRGALVKDKLMGSVAFVRGVRDGYVHDLEHPDRPLGGDDTWAGRGQVRAVFAPQSELRISGDFGRFDGVPLAEAKPIAATTDPPAFDNPPGPWDVRASHEATGWNHQYGTSAELTLPVSGMIVRSLTAWRKSDDDVFVDLDTTELPLKTIDVPDLQRQFSQEATLSRRASKLTWLGGVYAFDERVEGQVVIDILVPPGLQLRPHAVMNTSAWAIFGEATYDITDRISMTGGLRYSDETKDIDNTGGTYLIGTPVDPGYAYEGNAEFSAWTPKVSLQAKVSQDGLLYVSATRGFKSGGFNASAPVADVFRPELAWSYEGGLKRTLAGGRVRLNAALFYTDYQDLQVQTVIDAGFLDITNAASARIAGLEVEAGGPVHGVQLAGHLSWVDAKYHSATAVGPGNVTADAAGHHLNNAPEWSGSGSASREFSTGGAGFASVRGDVAWQSRVFFTAFNDNIETQGTYALAQLRAGFEPRRRRWEMAFYVRNLANTPFITATANIQGNPAISARPGVSRQWGTQLTLHP